MRRLVDAINAWAVWLMHSPLLKPFLGRFLAVIRYVGRKSGKTFEIPIAYRLKGNTVVIWVGLPDAKKWWRNFLEEAGPVTLLDLRGQDRTGSARAQRDERGRVTVRVQLDPLRDL